MFLPYYSPSYCTDNRCYIIGYVSIETGYGGDMKVISVKCRGCFKSFTVYGKAKKNMLFKMVDANHLGYHEDCKDSKKPKSKPRTIHKSLGGNNE